MILGLIIGILFTLIRGRNLAGILQVQYRAPFVLIAALILQIVLTILAATDTSFPQYALVFSFLVVIVGLSLNHRLPGVKFIIFGTCLNVLVVAVNAGLMPVSIHTLDLVGLHGMVGHLVQNSRHKAVPDFTHARLWWLGDWVPLIYQVASPGDIFVGVGLFRFVYLNAKAKGQ